MFRTMAAAPARSADFRARRRKTNCAFVISPLTGSTKTGPVAPVPGNGVAVAGAAVADAAGAGVSAGEGVGAGPVGAGVAAGVGDAGTEGAAEGVGDGVCARPEPAEKITRSARSAQSQRMPLL